LRPDCAPRSDCLQFGMPSERRAQSWVPNVARSRISERAPFRIYEHTQCRVFERTSLQRAYVISCRQQMGSSAVLRAGRSALVLAVSTRCLRRAHSIGPGCCVHTCVTAIGEDFKMYLLCQFCSNRVNFFTIHRRHRRKKWRTSILKFEFCNFSKFSKRRHTVPLQPIWTIMVAAKLDHSRVLVTKFHQNRSMLTGRNAGQRHTHTDRQTNWLKIRALQVCNQAKNRATQFLHSPPFYPAYKIICFRMHVNWPDTPKMPLLVGASTLYVIHVPCTHVTQYAKPLLDRFRGFCRSAHGKESLYITMCVNMLMCDLKK